MTDIIKAIKARQEAMVINASFPIHSPTWSAFAWDRVRPKAVKTQEEIDYDEAMALVNAIAPGWPLP